jgi:hypothetical protein
MRYEIRGPVVKAGLNIVNLEVVSSDLKWLLGKPMKYVREYVDSNRYELWLHTSTGWIKVLPCVPLGVNEYNKLAARPQDVP